MPRSPSPAQILSRALDQADPELLARLFDLPSHLRPESSKKLPPINLKSGADTPQDSSLLTDSWQQLLQLLASLQKAQNAQDAFDVQKKIHSLYNANFANSSGNWCVPALHAVCRNTFYLANLSDGDTTKESAKEMAVTLLQESFSRTLNDRTVYNPNDGLSTTGSKKEGVLCVVNILFKIYFKLNKLRLCKNLLKPVESYKLNTKSTDMTQKIVFNYYVGRLFLFEDNFEKAEQCLMFAYSNAEPWNKRRILNFLLPIKLLRGRLPQKRLLEKYEMHQYVPLVDGLRNGDLKSFSDALEKYGELFLKRGTFLLLEKCKYIVYRNLFKRCWMIMNKTNQIPLHVMQKALIFCGTSVDIDEVECIAANLIYRNYMRGYLSHTKRVLVLSKRDPFPTASVIK
eukprot:CAMPEP_0116008274 /NCGR_PEP_ID=MMETSP0321-20121206/2772_1 /TAXON_ID=163516 /ORGANISM="Leptocylindrus danicus var. danicus, Strain B650" /LENGTH=399 /DNA_ID=CAMNT_0003477079 /DNA_START=38 /DNA_END=1237 /DNA_ORIENTATION=+